MKFNKVNRVSVLYDCKKVLGGLSQEDINTIKKELTFDNPLYATTQRYSRYAYTTVPPYLSYYAVKGGYVEVPIGYDTSRFKIGTVTDTRVYEKLEKVAPFVLELRGSQREAAESYLRENLNNPTLKGSIQMPTGKGKSILGLYLASALSTKTLIVVHKDDLVTGWQKDIALAFDGKVNAGLIKAKSRTIGHFITIATVQTLNKLSQEELDELFNKFGFVIQDEMHHCPASSFEVVSRFRARYKLGLTATPERADGLAHVMNLYFGDFCYRYKPDENEEDKDILPAKVIVRNNPLYFNPLCKPLSGSKYKVVDLYYPKGEMPSESLKRLSEVPYTDRPRVPFQVIDDFVVRGIMEQVCQDIITEYDRGHSCVVFFTQKEHCRIYYERLLASISEDSLGLYYGDNSNNDEVLEKAERIRKFVTLTTYAKATEGTNVKQWEVEFLVSSINNEKNTEQAVGRVRRTKEGCKISPVLVYDYRTPNVYSVSSHGKTRDARYRHLRFEQEGMIKKSGLFTVGFKSSHV